MPNFWVPGKTPPLEPPLSVVVENHLGIAVRVTVAYKDGKPSLWLHAEDAPPCVLPGCDVSPVWLIPPAKEV